MALDSYYMNKAMQAAEKAAAIGEVPVGALLLFPDGSEFIEHNAPISTHDTSAHAEMRVIRSACKALQNYRLAGSTLYVTLEPCSMCAGAIIHARIARVVYAATDAKTGAVESLYQLLSDPRLNHQPEISSGIMAEESAALLKQFFRARRKASKQQSRL
ncbi:tRNA adenosine(34) deaminase TadA [Mariprofundus sp. EBB-1]|uniref:tRNA adenosine(34) deaminase TadA n=1 Tax=Mariprofundus sp. EBB-1 TaxID=2650971 RepID=UPI000EF18268|nr:tRNA adenosine(34) deaminase TadA [Mariprofundus sp. EBB-1]RLL50803.1 tRNA adenosine(34) deaminase TadA [Mariprofundus sp. EBB-1]